MAGFMDYLGSLMGQGGGMPAGLPGAQMMGGMPPDLMAQLQQMQAGQQGFGLGQQLPGMPDMPQPGQMGQMGPMAGAMMGGQQQQDTSPMAGMMGVGQQLMQMGQQNQQQMPGAMPIAGMGGQGMQRQAGMGQGYMAQGGGIAPRRQLVSRG